MGISDLLAMLQGGGAPGAMTDSATPAALSGPTPPTGDQPAPMGGVAGMIGSTSPDPMMGNAPQPQAAGDPLALAPGQTPAGPQAMQAPVTYTPPDSGGGVGDFLSRQLAKASAQDPTTGLSFWDRAGQGMARFGDNPRLADQIGDKGSQRVADAQAAQRRAELQKMADDLGMSPREKLMFAANPQTWVDANKGRLGYHDQAPGSTGYYGEPGQGGSTQVTAPEKTVDPLAAGKTQAEIDALRSRKALQDAQAGYYGVKTKQPYAPKAPKGLGNAGDWRSRVVGQGSIQ